jgi:tetratricopeptide (TPR) repeat protein
LINLLELLIAIILNNLGVVAADQGDSARAVVLYQESLAQYRKLGDGDGSARALLNLGEIALSQGDYRSAAPMYHDGLALAQEIGGKELIAYGLEGLAGVAAAQGSASGHAESLLRAAQLWGAAQVLRSALNAPLPPLDIDKYERPYVQETRP